MRDLARSSLTVFLDRMAATDSMPGGGSAVALQGAMAAALLCLVGRLTVARISDETLRQAVEQDLAEAEAARQTLLQAVDDDARALDALLLNYRLPHGTEAERARRAAALAETGLAAAMVPLQVMREAARLMDLCARLAEVGSRLAISDVGVAVLAAEATLRGAALNVEINLANLAPNLAEELRSELAQLSAGRAELRDEVLNRVRARM